ncbi:MAG: hypothetical protein AAF657_24220 [Acidobacteriota bacterium]
MLRHLTLTLTMALAAAPAAWSQTPCPDPESDLALSAYLTEYAACAEQHEKASADGRFDGESSAAATRRMQAASPASTEAGFGSQLRDSIEDYLSLFSFAIDGVSTSEDDRSLTIRFNPIRSGSLGSLGLSVTATEPQAGELVLNEIPEAERAAASEALETGLDESDDLTFKASFGFERKATKHDRWLLGRSYDNYRALVERDILPTLASGTFSSAADSDSIQDCEAAADAGLNLPAGAQLYAQPIDAIARALSNRWPGCLKAWQSSVARVVEADKKLDALDWLPFLIDNQPQLILSAEIRDRAEAIGRSGWNVKLSYEKGLNNLNTLLRRAAGKQGDAWRRAFYDTVGSLSTREVEAENKMTFSFTYAERDPYMFSRTFGEDNSAVAVALDLPRATEISAKFEYHRNATWHEMKINDQKVFPKLHASVEYVDVSDDPKRRDRLVGVLTYEIPLPSGVALPLSLTYANHSRFLGDVDDELSAHFGLSYKLPGS